MASVKLVLRKAYKKSDGTSPLAIRITKDRKTRFVFTGYYIKENQWDEEEKKVKSHSNASRLNNLLLKRLSEINNTVIESETNNEQVTSKEIKNKIKKAGRNVTFFELANQRIEAYKMKGTYSVSNAEESILNNIKNFVGNEDLTFQEISVPFIERLKVYCSATLEQSPRTVTNHLIFIRTLFNLAIKEGIVNVKYYPFAGDNIKIRIGSGLKIGLTQKEIEKIENLDLKSGTSIWHTRNVWLFAFYFAGVRISDVINIKWSDLKDGRLNYVMHKNDKPVSLKVPVKAKKILKHYRRKKSGPNDYVFPFLKKANQKDHRDIFRKSRNASRLFNKYLKKIATQAKINKNLSNHIARHSFGNIAGDKIHPLMLQKLYRHTDLKTTINYQANFIHKEADDALNSVIDF